MTEVLIENVTGCCLLEEISTVGTIGSPTLKNRCTTAPTAATSVDTNSVARQGSLKMEAAGHKSMRALHQSIKRHERTSQHPRRNSVALRRDSIVVQPQVLTGDIGTSAAEESLYTPSAVTFPKRCAACQRKIHTKLKRISSAMSMRENPLPEDPSCFQVFKHNFRCPPHGYIGRWLTGVLSIIILFGIMFVLVKKEALPGKCVEIIPNYTKPVVVESNVSFDDTSVSSPLSFVSRLDYSNISQITSNMTTKSVTQRKKTFKEYECTGNFFGMYILFVCSMISSSFSKKLNLPPLLGMLIVGCLLRNVPYINFARNISKKWFSALREIALCIILLRAGLSMDPATLRRLSAAVFRLSFTPCIVESCVDAVAAYFLLGFPWEWGFMLGFVLGAVSPAVVVLSMLKLEYRGFGVEKGIPTLVIAAASMDDVLAITGFSLALGIAFNRDNTNIAVAILQGPIEAFVGISYGLLLGFILWYIPHRSHKRPIMFRFFFLVGGGLIALLGSHPAKLPGAGALGVLTLAFMAGYGWRKWDGWAEDENPMLEPLDTLWWFMQPMLFGLIGAQIDVLNLDISTLGLGLAVVGIGLIFRMLASFLVMLGTNLNFKERVFIPFAWLPKATVQAAIGPVALDMALSNQPRDEDQIIWGFQIVTIAAIVILLTAPIGAFFIGLLGPKLLHKDVVEHHQLGLSQLHGANHGHGVSHGGNHIARGLRKNKLNTHYEDLENGDGEANGSLISRARFRVDDDIDSQHEEDVTITSTFTQTILSSGDTLDNNADVILENVIVSQHRRKSM